MDKVAYYEEMILNDVLEKEAMSNEDELLQLVNAADAYIKEYKETHEGWL